MYSFLILNRSYQSVKFKIKKLRSVILNTRLFIFKSCIHKSF